MELGKKYLLLSATKSNNFKMNVRASLAFPSFTYCPLFPLFESVPAKFLIPYSWQELLSYIPYGRIFLKFFVAGEF